MEKKIIKKQVSNAFGKQIYLIGEDESGTKYWLEHPKWDCGWYWGFGYVETYTNNNNPGISRDINSHQHLSGFIGQQEVYDHDKQCFRKGEHIHNLYDQPLFTKLTFNKEDGWKLTELIQQFYILKEFTEFCHSGGAHITTSPIEHDPIIKEYEKNINENMIPKITAAICEMLTPKKETA